MHGLCVNRFLLETLLLNLFIRISRDWVILDRKVVSSFPCKPIKDYDECQ